MDIKAISITFPPAITGSQYVLTECKELSEYLNDGYKIDEMKSAGSNILIVISKPESEKPSELY